MGTLALYSAYLGSLAKRLFCSLSDGGIPDLTMRKQGEEIASDARARTIQGSSARRVFVCAPVLPTYKKTSRQLTKIGDAKGTSRYRGSRAGAARAYISHHVAISPK